MITGHVEVKDENRCKIVLELGRDPGTGKRKRKTITFYGNEDEANREMYRIIDAMEKGTYIEPTSMTFGEWILKWLEFKKNNLSPTTYNEYVSIAELRVIPRLGKVKLKDLKPMHIQMFYFELQNDRRVQTKDGYVKGDKPLSASRIRYHHALINGALQAAVKLKILEENPAASIELPKVRKKQVRILSRQELATLFEDLKKTPHYAVVLFTLSTGMRRGEVFGLRWRDVDLDKGIVTINQTLIYTPQTGCVFKDNTKNDKTRTVVIPPLIIELLKKHKVEQAKQKLQMGPNYTDFDLVFCRPDGKPRHPDSISRWFSRYAKRKGFEEVTFHKLRHTHVSYLMEQGIIIKAVQERVGHSSSRVTMDIYGHLVPGYQEQMREKIDAGLADMLNSVNGTSHN